MTRRCVPTWAAAAVLGLATQAALAADDPEASLSAELRKQHPLPAKLKPAAGDDAVRILLIARHNTLRDEFYHLLGQRNSPKHQYDQYRLVGLPRELAELQVELEPDSRRQFARLEPILVTAKAIEEFVRGRVSIGQERPQTEYRAAAERLGVEALVVRAQLAAGAPPPPPRPAPKHVPQGKVTPRAEPQGHYKVPEVFAPALPGEPVRALLVERYNTLLMYFELEHLRRTQGCDWSTGARDELMTTLKELAELEVELERNPARLVKDLELLLDTATHREAYFHERVRIGQDPAHWALRVKADRLEIEARLAEAKKALKP